MTDCDLWTGGCTSAGYGETFRHGRVVYAHRVAWEDAIGPIPEGVTVHHRCGERRCCDPAHMELLRRDDHAGALGHGKLTREQAREIRALFGTLPQAVIARRYGVARSLVSMIGNGKRWAAA